MSIHPGTLHPSVTCAAIDAPHAFRVGGDFSALPFGRIFFPTANPWPKNAPDAAHDATEEPGN